MRYSSSESNIYSRRYELPTCSLEVWTERSPLSEWQSQIVAQNMRFQLQLANGQKTIKGNQQQITNLIEAVTTYCDRWLAQDDFNSLNHVIEIPKLSKLQLSTLQLFDLYESLELCANEFVILPHVVLEVRRLNLNWLKIVAGAIALMGVSIGAIRLIYPLGEQPSYQVASSPAASSSEQAPAPPSISADKKLDQKSDQKLDKSESAAKIADVPKSAKTNPNEEIFPAAPNPSQSNRESNRDAKVRERVDKVAIVPESSNSPSKSSNNVNNDRQRATANSPSSNNGITSNTDSSASRRSELPNKDASQNPNIASESAKPSPSAPSAKVAIPSVASRTVNRDRLTKNIKILEIQSELPSDITKDLERYLQSQNVSTSAIGTLVIELEIAGDRLSNITISNQNSTLKDTNAIAEIEKLLRQWRSPSSITGEIRLILQTQ